MECEKQSELKKPFLAHERVRVILTDLLTTFQSPHQSAPGSTEHFYDLYDNFCARCETENIRVSMTLASLRAELQKILRGEFGNIPPEDLRDLQTACITYFAQAEATGKGGNRRKK